MEYLRAGYRIAESSEQQARQTAGRIMLEQSAELPRSVVDSQPLPIPTGELQELNRVDDEHFSLTIKWPIALFDGDRLQLLNVLMGNISLLPGIRLESVAWNDVPELFEGPRLGIDGLREEMTITDRSLSCAALKPLGLPPEELAELSRSFGRAGIDLVKDDHGLTDQKSAPFAERLRQCAGAAGEVEQQRGRPFAYIPNVTGSREQLNRRLEMCRNHGVRMVMITPHLTGPDALTLPREFELGVVAHPAFSGAMVLNPESGISPSLLYGEIWRAFGADAAIYPNAGGRFVLQQPDCERINSAARDDQLPWKRSWPMPGGGIRRDTIATWVQRYGRDTIFLIGGSLYEAPEGIEQAAGQFCRSLQTA